jgi:hypothetical protein
MAQHLCGRHRARTGEAIARAAGAALDGRAGGVVSGLRRPEHDRLGNGPSTAWYTGRANGSLRGIRVSRVAVTIGRSPGGFRVLPMYAGLRPVVCDVTPAQIGQPVVQLRGAFVSRGVPGRTRLATRRRLAAAGHGSCRAVAGLATMVYATSVRRRLLLRA